MQPGNHVADQTLSAFIDDQLTPDEATHAKLHLETCLVCSVRLDELRALVRLLQILPSVEPQRDFSIGPRLVRDPPNVVRLRRWYGVVRAGAATLAAAFVFLSVSALYVDSRAALGTGLSSGSQLAPAPAAPYASPAARAAALPIASAAARAAARAAVSAPAPEPPPSGPAAPADAAPAGAPAQSGAASAAAGAAAPADRIGAASSADGAAVPVGGTSAASSPPGAAAPPAQSGAASTAAGAAVPPVGPTSAAGAAVPPVDPPEVVARARPVAGEDVADQVTAATSVRALPTPAPTLAPPPTQTPRQVALQPFQVAPVDATAPLRSAAAIVGLLAVLGLLLTLVVRHRLRAVSPPPTE